MRSILLVLPILALGCACERRPPEPQAQHRSPLTSSTHATTSPKPSSSRCLVPSPPQPPPAASSASSCPRDPLFTPPTLPVASVSFPDAPHSPKLEVELAVTPSTQQRGLMYRTKMPEDHGMLFVFSGPPRVHDFWMHNTCIPLDMLYITEDGFIAGILENVPVLNDASRSVPCPVSYVLETNAGWTRRHGVFAGQHVVLPKKDLR